MTRIHRQKVALLIESSRMYGRNLLQGIALFARTQTNWTLLHQEMMIDADVPSWLRSTQCNGVIARVHQDNAEALVQLGVPAVDVLCRDTVEGMPSIETDDRQVAELAFDHLWERGFRHFAYCGYEGVHYSMNRLKYFKRKVVESGCTLSVYETPSRPDMRLTGVEQSWLTDARPMANWLQSLNPPTGLFASNDIRAQQVLAACRTLGIAVPDDLGVIGVDNDDTICELCDPPLSSVQPDAQQVGYRAAETLAQMLQGQTNGTAKEFVPPKGVIARASTEVDAIRDREVARICRFIREHACTGISVNDLVEVSSLSRRQLERRFRQVLGRSLHHQIARTQVTKVKQLLRETSLTLEKITPIAGYSHRERMTAVFTRETGESPGAYRKRYRHSSTANSIAESNRAS